MEVNKPQHEVVCWLVLAIVLRRFIYQAEYGRLSDNTNSAINA